MSTTVKKESTRKKSTKSAEENNDLKTAASKSPSARKTAVPKGAEKVEETAAEPAVKTSGKKPKSETEEPIAEKPVKKTVRKVSETEASAAENPQEEPVPKRKYTRRKTAEEIPEPVAAEPVKKTARKSKKAVEEEAAADENIDLETQVYNLIKSTPDGVYQNEVWKQMDIDSRKCSRILKKLLDSEQIIREEAVAGGTKTYLLKTVTQERKKNYDVLMVKDMFSPCTGCTGECRPEYCPALTFWIMNLSDRPEDLFAAMGYNSTGSEEPAHEVEMPPEFLEEMEAGEFEFTDEENEDLVFE